MITNLASFFLHQIRQGEEERDRVYEPVIGIVTDNKDPEKLLRVKVKIPSLSSQDTTFWISVISYGAGKERGWFFMPEVNDEVLVAFEHGDINHPVILGALWNGKDAPPEDSSGANTKRTMVSRSGSRIELDDEQNSITITDGGGKGSIVFKADDNKLLIEAKQGDVFLMAPAGKLQIVAKGGVELDASVNLDIRAQGKTNVSGANVTVKASGPLAITGAQVNINNGGAEAAAAVTNPQETPDESASGGGGGGGGASSGAEASGTSSAGGGSSPTAAAASSSAASARPRNAGAAPSTEPEPQPVLVSAAWEKPKGAPATPVKLKATCSEMAGKPATFTIKDADDPGKVIATVTGSCGAASAEASWTTPSDGPPSRFVFEVEADGKKATSGVHVLVKPVEATLMLDEEPAAKARVKLRVDPSGELLSATADDQGKVRFAEAPLGKYTLLLEEI